MFTVGIVVLSDKGSRGEREDLSGPKIREMLPDDEYDVVSYKLIADERALIEYELMRLSDELKCNLVLTSGGTGLSLRDVTPEATLAVADRNVLGIAEAIRANSMQYTKRAMLSRAVAVTRGKTLIINLPGSPKAVEECLGYILSELPHAIGILCGTDGECGKVPK
jgi:molybdenum cofactor synthesis domain-containing protein